MRYCYLDKPWKHDKEASHKRPHTIRFHLYEIATTGKPIKTEIKWWLSWPTRRRRRHGEVSGNGYRVSICVMKCFRIREWWWMYNSANVLETTEFYTLKGQILWDVNYILNCYFFKKTSRAQGLLPKKDTLKLILKKRKQVLKTTRAHLVRNFKCLSLQSTKITC